MKSYEFKVKMKMDWDGKKSEALAKLKAWMEHNAHTTSNFGFELEEVGYIMGNDL